MKQPVPETVKLKDPKDFHLIGKPTGRLDAQAKSSGHQNYGIDMRLPGMLTAVVAHPPVFGAKLKSVDDSAAQGRQGRQGRAARPRSIAAAKAWPLSPMATGPPSRVATRSISNGTPPVSRRSTASTQLAQYRDLATQAGSAQVRRRHVEARQRAAARSTPSSCSPIWPMRRWSRSTAPSASPASKAELGRARKCRGSTAWRLPRSLGVPPQNVKVNVQMAGGGFGRRGLPASDFVAEACDVVKAAQAAGIVAPVRTLWSREDDIRGGYYRPMHLHREDRLRRAMARSPAWDHVIVGQSHVDGHRVRADDGQGRHRRHRRRRHEGAVRDADAAHGASPEDQRAGALVAQRRLHPHRVRHGNVGRRDRPHHQAGPGRLPHEAHRRQAPAAQGGAATGGGQIRLWQEASWKPAGPGASPCTNLSTRWWRMWSKPR